MSSNNFHKFAKVTLLNCMRVYTHTHTHLHFNLNIEIMHLGLGDFQAVYLINFGLYYKYNPKFFCNPRVVIYIFM